MCFVWISEQTAIISLYSVDWLVFINETESVYCAVRTVHLTVPTKCTNIIPLTLPAHPVLYVAVAKRKTGEDPRDFHETMTFRKSGSIGQKSTNIKVA